MESRTARYRAAPNLLQDLSRDYAKGSRSPRSARTAREPTGR